jgi:hypothetical protein
MGAYFVNLCFSKAPAVSYANCRLQAVAFFKHLKNFTGGGCILNSNSQVASVLPRSNNDGTAGQQSRKFSFATAFFLRHHPGQLVPDIMGKTHNQFSLKTLIRIL